MADEAARRYLDHAKECDRCGDVTRERCAAGQLMLRLMEKGLA